MNSFANDAVGRAAGTSRSASWSSAPSLLLTTSLTGSLLLPAQGTMTG